MVTIATATCDEKGDAEPSLKNRRAASISSFSYASKDYTKYDGRNGKTMTLAQKLEIPSHSVGSYETYDKFPQRMVMGKTTVEYWPPDMDKDKFYSMSQDSTIHLWPQNMKTEMKLMIQKPLPESIPDIPSKPKPEAPDLQPMLGPTETIIIDEVAITNRAPVVFPTSLPTTKSPDRNVAFVSRGNSNKKRKLKKKVKTAPVPFVETSPISDSFPPSSNSVTEISLDNHNYGQATPIYENIDEPYTNIFEPIRYTDVIGNLSDLTELAFGSRNDSNRFIEIIDNSQPAGPTSDITIMSGDAQPMINLTASNLDNLQFNSNASDDSQVTFPSLPRKFNELTAFDKMLSQLRRAIDERDLAKIRNIVQMFEASKPPTTASPEVTKKATTATSSPMTMSLPSSMVDSEATTVRSKVYLAPRVRNAQRKFNQLKTKASADEKLKEDNNITVTEIFTTKLPSTTEKMTTTKPISSVTATRKGRSQLTPRIRNVVTKSSRLAARSIRRRILD